MCVLLRKVQVLVIFSTESGEQVPLYTVSGGYGLQAGRVPRCLVFSSLVALCIPSAKHGVDEDVPDWHRVHPFFLVLAREFRAVRKQRRAAGVKQRSRMCLYVGRYGIEVYEVG